MEVNVSTSFGSPCTPVMSTNGGGILPPPPHSPIRTSVVPTPKTSGNSLIPLTTLTTIPFNHNVMGAPFSYGNHEFDTNLVLTYSTLQTMGLGVGTSNASLQGSTMGTIVPFNAIPYSGGHIPPPSPLLDGTFQPIVPNTNYSLIRGGNVGPSSYTTPVVSMSFSLFDAFGKKTFSSTTLSTGGNHNFGQQNPVQGIIPSHGAMTGVYSTQGL
jgi:hypothetical protein